MTIDMDSTVCEVHGHHKGGAAYGYTHQLGYHPLLATRADTGEVLHVRMRTGSANTARGASRFVNELAGRLRRPGAAGELVLRADSGFWSAKVIGACQRHRIRFSITVRQTKTVAAAIAAIDEDAWTEIDYPDGGLAQVAETILAGERLVVRRTRLVGPQATLWPDWRYHAFVSNRAGGAVELDADHRRHAVGELAIRELKDGAGLRHCPSGVFLANAAWAVIASLAHNLLRWICVLGFRLSCLVEAKTVRRRYLTLPGRLTRSGRRTTLHLPAAWPWATGFLTAVERSMAWLVSPAGRPPQSAAPPRVTPAGAPMTVPEVHIRPLRGDDAKRCDQIIASLPYHFGQEDGRRQCAHAVRTQPGLVAVLNTVVGFLTLQRHFNHAAEITWMAVHASHRHHGVGRGRSSSGSAKT